MDITTIIGAAAALVAAVYELNHGVLKEGAGNE